MAYQVLARKYRPQRFADVAGQGHVTVTLMNALTQGRIAHGYIFSGHRGIGKTTIARILAMALNCRNQIGSAERPTAEPCERCESCTEIRAGNAVDVIEIDAATNRGIDEIRELRDAARYRPARDRYKIYILDEAHQITDAAFNALLKTLEEPPEHIVFMMATTQPEDIPQTVRSRCQHFSFHAVRMDDILQELRSICEAEKVVADEAALSLVAEAGDGSMRDALSVMDQAIASAPVEEGVPQIHAGEIRELMGAVPNTVFERLLSSVNEGRTAEVITVANELMDAGNSPVQLARQCVRFLRNCLMAKIAGLLPDAAGDAGTAAELLQISPEERRRAARSAALFSEEELTRFLQVMLRTFDELGFRQEPRLHLELGLLKLVHLRRLLPLEEVLSGLGTAPAPAGPALPARSTPGRPAPREIAAPAAGMTYPPPAAPPPARETRDAGFSPFAADRNRRAPEITLAPPQSAPKPPVGEDPSRGNGVGAAPPPITPAEQIRRPAVTPSAAATSAAPEQPQSAPPEVIPSLAAVAAYEAEHGPIQASEPQAALPATGVADTEALQRLAVESVGALAGQSSAADALGDAEWTVMDDTIVVQTAISKMLLPVVINPEAERTLRNTLRGAAPGLKLELLPANTKAAAAPKAKKPARTGSAQARAEEHPIVQEAQRLFHAEIRKVIDLREGE